MTMTALTAARQAYLDAVDVYTTDKTLANRDAAIAAGKTYTDAIIAAGGDPTNDALLEDDFFTNPIVITAARRKKVKSAFGLTFPMIWRFVTTEPNQSVVVNVNAGGSIDVDWGDGVVETGQTGANLSHAFAAPGTYDVSIVGTIVGFVAPPANDTTLTELVSWGDESVAISTYTDMFRNRKGLVSVPSDPYTFTPTSQAQRMFLGASGFNQDLNHWDVSGVTNMSAMFLNATVFNGAIGDWNTANVAQMVSMFSGASAFNQPIGNWDVSNVNSMSNMFTNAASFNQPIGDWNTTNVTSMTSMFRHTDAFNQPIGNWDVSSVTSMNYMFDGADAFNQDISGWTVTSVTNMESMFQSTGAFNQDISTWDVSSVIDMESMFQSAQVFNQDISGWNVANVSTSTDFATNSALDTANNPFA